MKQFFAPWLGLILSWILIALAFGCSGPQVSTTSDIEGGAQFSEDPNRSPSYGHNDREEGKMTCRFTPADDDDDTAAFQFVGYRASDGGIYIKMTDDVRIWPNHVLRFDN